LFLKIFSDLAQWLWSTLIQEELDNLRETFNNHRTRKDKQKFLPSGVSSNVAFALHETYGGSNGLLHVDRRIIEKLMEEIGGEELIRFVPVEYAARARGILEDKLGAPKLTMSNVWDIFQAMLPHM
jgi:hypothetical protein